MTGLTRQIVVVLLTGLMLATNLFGGGGGFSDDGSAASVYYRFPTSFSPAPFTFAIWLPIFLGTIVLAVHQALPAQRRSIALDRMALPYAAALIANALTPFVDLGLSNLIVLLLFLALVAAYLAFSRRDGSAGGRLFVRLPLALFGTWAGLATLVNLCQLLVARGVPVDPAAAGLLFLLSAGLGGWALAQSGEIVIALVLIWAGLGLAVANGWTGAVTAAVALATVGTASVAWFRGDWRLVRTRRDPR